MDGLTIVALLSRWVHLLSAIVAIGGAIFTRFALMPAAAALPAEAHEQLRSRLMPRWRKLVHTCVGLLLVTGSFNFYMAIHDGVKPMPYHPIFGVKFLAALGVFFFAIALTGTSPGFAKLRQNNKKWLGVQIALAVLVVLLSGVLKVLHQGAGAAG